MPSAELTIAGSGVENPTAASPYRDEHLCLRFSSFFENARFAWASLLL
jgi:hypothetical protein